MNNLDSRKSFYFRYWDIHGIKREKEICETTLERATERFYTQIRHADLYDIVY